MGKRKNREKQRQQQPHNDKYAPQEETPARSSRGATGEPTAPGGFEQDPRREQHPQYGER